MRLRSAAAALVAFCTAVPALAQEEPPPSDPEEPVEVPAPPPVALPAEPPPAAPPPQITIEAPPPPAAYAAYPAYPAYGVTIGFAPAAPGPRDTAQPSPASRSGDTHFDIGFGTEAPISIGGVATLEVPGRLLFQLGLGFMPHGYANAIDGFLTAVKAYDQSISGLVRNSLGNSFVLRASGGWRPFPNAGLEILAGYTLMTLGGSATAADVINAVLIEAGSSQRVAGMTSEIPLQATLHNVHVSLGWRWLAADDHLVIRASLSYLQCLASNVSVDLASLGGQAAAAEGAVNEALNAFVGPYFSKYAKAPTIGLSAAYRF